MTQIKDMALPAIAGGVLASVITFIISFLGSIVPFIGFLNLCCFLWIIAGGFLAAYMLKNKTGKIEMKDGAIVGVLSGVVYAVMATLLISILIVLGSGISMAYGDMGQTVGVGAAFGLMVIIISFLINLVLGAIFGAIGGVIGAAVLKK